MNVKHQKYTHGLATFDYLFLIPGIASGMAIARVLQFFGEILAYHPKEMPTILHIVWLIALILFILQNWYFMLDWREKEVIKNFKQYILCFFFPASTYIIAVLLCPSHDELMFTKLSSLLTEQGYLIYIMVGLTMLFAAAEGELIEKKSGLKFAYKGETLARAFFGALFLFTGIITFEWKHQAAVGLLIVSGIFRLVMTNQKTKLQSN